MLTSKLRIPTYLRQFILIREQTQKSNTERPDHGYLDTVGQPNLTRHKDIPPTTLKEGIKATQELSAITFQSSKEMG